jgi:UDP-N-acetylmuramate--alanine ligase
MISNYKTDDNYHIPEMRRIKNIHFVGIGGSGMCGIAEVLLYQGYSISGSDLNDSATINRLKSLGVKVFISHNRSHVYSADVVVKSTAIPNDNPEILQAYSKRIPIVSRAQMLSELMRFRHGIAVSGTHGKTTTTSMLASVFGYAGLDPTYIIGGRLNSTKNNGYMGKSRYLIAEADESDTSFLHLQPMVSIVTNIDMDHMITYQGDFNKLKKTFIDFLHNLPFYGIAIVCIDCPVVRELLPQIKRRVITYGESIDADFRAIDITYKENTTSFKVVKNFLETDNKEEFTVTINIPGQHNVMNALAVFATAADAGIQEQKIISGLNKFSGVGRRFQIKGNFKSKDKDIILVDDYGHHPTEIAATIKAVRSGWPDRKLIVVYQPHRYTRTNELYDDFVIELSKADVLFLLDVYTAGEKPIANADSRCLCRSIRNFSTLDPIYVADNNHLFNLLQKVVTDKHIILMQGAGDIGLLVNKIQSDFQEYYTLAT